MATPLFPRLACAIITAALFSSCASVSVKETGRTDSARPAGKPQRIYVEPFSVSPSVVKENFARRNKGQLAGDAQRLLTAYLVQEISKSVAPATAVPRGGAPRGGWLVSGEITRIAEGNRLLRMGIGLGSGGTKFETNVAVRNLPAGNPPFLRFSTTGGSNAMPGAATSPVPFTAVPTAIIRSSDGVTDDIARTARSVSSTLAEYMAERGWIDPASVKKAKRVQR